MTDPTPYGAAQPEPTPYAAGAPVAQKTNVLAIVSLVLAFVVSLGAVICGHIALGQIKRTGEGGRGLALAGLILGYIGIVGGIIAIIASIALAGAAATYPSGY
ncbi:DUF4190 domain-containing protein [Homoserinibacter sp. YIM 151385]|uniref:DUF4190 domain-containing protein n=1 Tax=Homoserinibacter sp. YIM 151385 TaxID=2985506 RepID=UPI0022F10285|nr:DUF4190 domain-containing protein [Homoserinibacter sp. YIM 151385]WBU37717.1 DUF4190 domain-containing protein [Homoserinibacter sp. YIM 151385]